MKRWILVSGFLSIKEFFFIGVLLSTVFSNVENPGFESVTQEIPDSWNIKGASVSIDSQIVFEGQHSLRLTDTGPSDAPIARSSGVTLNPPNSIQCTASVMCYLKTGIGRLYLEFWNSDSVRIKEVHLENNILGTWYKMKITALAPAEAHYSTIAVYGTAANTGTAYYDDAQWVTEDTIGTTSLQPLDISIRKQLFIDDFLIDTMANVNRVLNKAQKLPPVVEAEYAWEGNGSGTWIYGTVLKDSGLYKMWYTGYNNKVIITCYATSEDGINWEKPLDLGVVPNTNIVGNFEISSVVIDEDDIPERRYKMLTYVNPHKYQTFYSVDGIHWNLLATHLPYGDVSTMAYDSVRDEYVICEKIWQGGKRIQFNSVSSDLEHFSTPVMMKDLTDAEDAVGYVDAQSYGMGLYPYEGIYIGFNWVFQMESSGQGDRGPIDVQLIFSRDLNKQWQRPSRTPIISRGNAGSFDAGMIITSSYPIRMGNEIWLYYGGFPNKHTPVLGGVKIAIAKWRLDGFMSLNTTDTSGTLLTKEFRFSGNHLLINADASDNNASLQVEILDSTGQVIEGYGKDDCTAISSDSVEHIISWQGKYDLSQLTGQHIRLKLYMQNTKLYAFQFGEPSMGEVPEDTTTVNSVKPVLSPSVQYFDFNGQTFQVNDNIKKAAIFDLKGKQIIMLLPEMNMVCWDYSRRDGTPIKNGVFIVRLIGEKHIQSFKYIVTNK
ncbi:MAG: hypothetical protein HQK83_09305 [Fibrobacteria bacterium]|nr:hypothetical protein [Fibrobacteria bacterium]